MPPRKTYRRRRPVRRRRRFPKRQYTRMGRRFDGALGRVFNFKRTVDVPNLECNANTGFVGFGYSFKLNQIQNFTEFSSLFNEIRLMGVQLTFYPAISNNVEVSGLTIPELYTVFDPCDSGAPFDETSLNQYSNLKRRYLSRPAKYFIRPNRLQIVAQTLSESSTTYARIPMGRKAWLRCAISNSAAVEHFGFRGAVVLTNVSTTSTPYTIRCTAKYYFQCRQLR